VAGPLRVASSVSFGRLQLAPRLRGFLQVHPQVSVDLQLSDQNVDLLSEGVDVAIRIGELKDSNLIARQIGLTRRLTVASPATWRSIRDRRRLKNWRQHNCLLFTLLKQFDTWSFDDGRYSVQVRGNVHSNNSEAIREMVLSGLGISLSPSWLYREDIDAGQGRTDSAQPHALVPADLRRVPGQPQAVGTGAGVCGFSGGGVCARPGPYVA
jgi:DNA-binding transcriptional LysR family regulator